MHKDPFVFSQLAQFLNRSKFNRIVAKYDGDKYVKSYTCWNQLLTMMFGQLSNRESLRDLIVALEAHAGKVYHLGIGKSVTRSNLSKANEQRDYRIFEEFAFFMIAEARKRRIQKIFELDGHVYAFDSTTIDLCLIKKIALEHNDSEEQGMGAGRVTAQPQEDNEYLSVIIKTLNDTFGVDLTEEDKVDLQRLRDRLTSNEELLEFFNPDNSRDNIRERFNEEVDNELLEFINSKLELYNKLTEDRVNTLFKQLWFNELYDARVRGIR